MTRVQELYPDNKVILREVGLRDGLQLVKKFPSTTAKQRWMRDEYAAGVRHFEVGSFLPAKTFPQFADVRDIIGTVASLPGAYGSHGDDQRGDSDQREEPELREHPQPGGHDDGNRIRAGRLASKADPGRERQHHE